MRSPSARCLINRVDLYRFTPVKDAAGGITGNPYPTPFATSVPCSVQPAAPERIPDFSTGRVMQTNMCDVVFATNPGLGLDDKIVWVDTASVPHNFFVQGVSDQAGRGGAFIANCEEVL